jgi:hypothetical protein
VEAVAAAAGTAAEVAEWAEAEADWVEAVGWEEAAD